MAALGVCDLGFRAEDSGLRVGSSRTFLCPRPSPECMVLLKGCNIEREVATMGWAQRPAKASRSKTAPVSKPSCRPTWPGHLDEPG